MTQRLADIAIGTTVTVSSVGGRRSFRRRLMEMGMTPGTQVSIVSIAPLGDPLEIKVRGSRISVRRAEAAEVGVE